MATKKGKGTPLAQLDAAASDLAGETGEDGIAGELAGFTNPVEMVTIPFRGYEFTIPKRRGRWSTEGTVYLAEQKFNVATKYLLGHKQWKLLLAICGDNNDAFNEFFLLFAQTIKRECVE